MAEYDAEHRQRTTIRRAAEKNAQGRDALTAAQTGRESICFYSQASRTMDDLRRETICALRAAITNEQLQLHYQPVVDLERDPLPPAAMEFD